MKFLFLLAFFKILKPFNEIEFIFLRVNEGELIILPLGFGIFILLALPTCLRNLLLTRTDKVFLFFKML